MQVNNKLLEKYNIYIGEENYISLSKFISNGSFSKVFILVDEHTHTHCLPILICSCPVLGNAEVIEIESGENSKTLETAAQLWYTLTELEADRKSLLINLGGGIISDLGGFIASTFKRGISFINVPTSLLGQIDASVGGKTGINLDNLKNQIGSFVNADATFIFPKYLKTLKTKDLLSGYGEAIKHSILNSNALWTKLIQTPAEKIFDYPDLITEIMQVKLEIVDNDFSEKGLRKSLNYGHTVGHAIESVKLKNNNSISHGEAISHGMVIANIISELLEIHKIDFKVINKKILQIFPSIKFTDKEHSQIIDLLKHDKKNSHGNLNFSLIKDFGETIIDHPVDTSTIKKALEIYQSL
ncbi:MAG: 3-dehydroquinate synthase family protein [Bacteroidales bacterium]